MYLSHLLVISQNYIFTNLRIAIMNKGQHTEGQVLSTTDLTQTYCAISCSLPLRIDSNLISYQVQPINDIYYRYIIYSSIKGSNYRGSPP